ERAVVPAELDRIVAGGRDLAMGALGALEGVGRAERVLLAQAPVAAERQLVQLAVQRQVADAGRRAGAEHRIPDAGLAGHHAALRTVLGRIAPLARERVVHPVGAVVVLALVLRVRAPGDGGR